MKSQYNHKGMGALFSQIFSLLTAPAGSLIYHLVLVFSIASALQSAFIHWRSSEFPQARRTMVGLGLLLAAQILLFILSALSWSGLINPTTGLPPLDRAFTLFSIIWITWLWAFPEPSRPADAGAVLLSAFAAAAAGLGLLTWGPQSSLTTYNTTIDELLWQLASIGFILFGIVILVLRRPNGFGNGLAVLGIAFLGHTGHVFFQEAGNYSGIIRLAYITAFPILLTLPQRFPLTTGTVQSSSNKQEKSGQDQKRYTSDPKTFHALLALAAESNATKVSHAITRAIAQTMLADLCFLVYLTDNKKQLMFASGYDLIREENLDGGSLSKTSIPMLTTALQRGRPLRLPASSTSSDIKGLSEMLGLSNPGHLLSVPIVTPEKDPLGGVILLTPYSNRLWSAEDQAFLVNIAASLVPIIQRSQKVTKLEEQGEQIRQTLEAAHAQTVELERRNDELSKQIEAMTLQSEKDASLIAEREQTGMELVALRSAQEESQRTIQQLHQDLETVRKNGKVVEPQTEKDLKASLAEIARLKSQLVEANRKAPPQEQGHIQESERHTEQTEVIASISQELRQPMSSIIGYTDLLLGESVGILGALQRKFIERIKASTERMGNLIDDMIQLNTLEVDLTDLKPEAMDLNLIIDNAMAYTSSQVREKNISLHLDLPKKVAAVNADREALQQILIHLLQNAGSASPVEGTVRLKVQTTKENGSDFVMIQVTDSGGGIPEEDLPRVFTRLYRADNVLIQGVGDTGVGLSIAKTLTEAQHGKIWVESQAGTGATFNVLLPIVKETTPAEQRPRKEAK
jgi:signal transduction histidine kinase